MFRSLLQKEILIHLMTFRFAAALVTTVALVIVSVWVLGDDYLRRRNAYNLAAEETARQDHEIYVPSQISPTLHRPPSKLSIFTQGEDRRFGNSIQIRRWEVPLRAEGSFTDNMLMVALPPLDLYTIFAVVISLFGILFSYDAISGEREHGTLKLQCTGGVSRGAIFTAKFTGAVICLAIPLLIGLLAGLLLISLFFNIDFAAEQWLAIACMAGSGLIFGALFVALGLVCSSLVRRSSVALVLALFVWTMGVLVIPSAAQSVADFLVPLPPSSEVTNIAKATEREAVAGLVKFSEEHPAYWWGNWTGNWDIPGNGGYIKYDGSERLFNDSIEFVRYVEPMMLSRADRIWNVYNGQHETLERQAAIADAISLLSPSNHLRRVMTSLANTGYHVYGDFIDSARRYRRQMIGNFEQRGYFTKNALGFFTRRPAADVDDEMYQQRTAFYRQQAAQGRRSEEFMGPHHWGPLPEDQILPFAYISDSPDFAGALQPGLILIVSIAVAFSIGFVAFLRYDIR